MHLNTAKGLNTAKVDGDRPPVPGEYFKVLISALKEVKQVDISRWQSASRGKYFNQTHFGSTALLLSPAKLYRGPF